MIQGIFSAIVTAKVKGLTPDETNKIMRDATMNLLTWESIFITIACIYFFAAFRTDKPPQPPSAAALVNHKDITHGMWKDSIQLSKNLNYMLILMIFTLIYVIYAGLGFVINPLFEPFGYSTTQISIFGATFVIFGSIGAVMVGVYLDRTKRYLMVLRTIPVSSFVLFMVASFVIRTGSFYGSLLIVTFGGIACVPIIAVCYSLGTECTHPT